MASPADFLKWWSVGKDVLVVAIIPLVGWIVHLSVQNAVRDEHIKQLKSEVAALEVGQEQVDEVKADVQAAAIQMAKLEGKIDLANGRLDEIKSLLRGSP